MKLSDFIAETLTEVLAGVSRAAKAHPVAERGGFVCPIRASRERDYDALPVRDVHFDVAVTVEDSSTHGKSGGVSIKVIEADLSSQTARKVVGESRVKFDVPVSMPSTRIEDA